MVLNGVIFPEEYVKWNTVYRRFADCSNKGIWENMLKHFSSEPDMEYIMIDSTVMRAHACSSGASKKGAKPLVEVEGD